MWEKWGPATSPLYALPPTSGKSLASNLKSKIQYRKIFPPTPPNPLPGCGPRTRHQRRTVCPACPGPKGRGGWERVGRKGMAGGAPGNHGRTGLPATPVLRSPGPGPARVCASRGRGPGKAASQRGGGQRQRPNRWPCPCCGSRVSACTWMARPSSDEHGWEGTRIARRSRAEPRLQARTRAVTLVAPIPLACGGLTPTYLIA